MSTEQPALPPHAQVIQMATAHWVSKLVFVTAKLGLADLLASGPKTADEIAAATGTFAPALYRLMRTLSALGVVAEDDSKRFTSTPLGESLKTGAPGSARATVLTLGGPIMVSAFDEIMHSLETGEPGFDKANGMRVFDYLAQHPDEASLFSETMVGIHGDEPAAVAAAYDFSGLGTIVDVGGATGNLISTVLKQHPGPRGILFDLPHVVADAPAFLSPTGVADRVSIESGSFFESVPAGADAYLLSHIIHDWSEEQCLTILGNVRKAMKPDSKVLLIEMVLPKGNEFHLGKLLDMVMLVVPGGQERTDTEYATLLEKAGLKLVRVVPTASPVSVVEAVQA
jgi:hypothetical protein